MRAIERSLIDHASLVVERDEFIAANFAFACCARVDQSIDRQETVRTLGDMYEIAWERMAFVFGLLRCGQNVDQWIIVGRVAQDDDEFRLGSSRKHRIVELFVVDPEKHHSASKDDVKR